MILVDANVLLYAYDSSSPSHAPARTWLESVLAGEEEVRFGLVTLLAFVRIASNPQVFERPLEARDALAIVQEWLEQPHVAIAEPTPQHWQTLADVAAGGRARGNLVMDAHLVALAREYGATLVSTDRDFARFRGVRVVDPLVAG